MQPIPEQPLRLIALDAPEAFDTVEAADIEAARRALQLTPPEFAEQLGWSLRKYQRTLEAAQDDGFVVRDVALAVRGLVDVLLGADDDGPAESITDIDVTLSTNSAAKAFLGGRVFPAILPNIAANSGEWTAQVTPHLLRLVAARAMRGKPITYGAAATTLEERGLTKRVWPRTLYGMPLGAICDAMMLLSREGGMRIPLLSAIVVKASGQPGTGIDGMIKKFIKQHEESGRAKELLVRLRRDREALIQELQGEVCTFPHWPGVVRALGLIEA
ncbi:hypothetical protein E0493_20020 [Roseomonas sp. M0104]|uniref:Uncharacterized protein n=1 Tax=Teichococcus coralli TaxID=2545983 RepID=A0A845BHS7_9PROT|nr:hypothetical protein [Pseudoroseomonas coralli]MXP65640.1 hypothetical protein [Pseudoroseomonas coralli]